MKRFLALMTFLLLLVAAVAAQGNSNSNTNNGNAYGWGNGQNLITWLENGGAIPQPLVMAILFEARDWGHENFGLSLGQMRQKYNQGLLTIEYLYTAPPTLTFRVSFGGVLSIIVIGSF